ncbi:hypothetical protein TWF694_004601 [Orbilia ellipsospora]|uniref:BTB domain-containing protein n=1 Tax=Orbilia ellipsospora TaxID=2528407 RepID=A0AAV9WX19_9PEZI
MTSSSIYHNKDYSDIKIFAGANEGVQQCFDLHRVIITAKSKYFAAACKECFQEGKTKEISLDIESHIFEIIAKWMYECEIDLFGESFDADTVIAVYAGADYLQIADMKVDILRQLGKVYIDSQRHFGADKLDPYVFTRDLFVYAHMSEWESLRACVRCLVKSWYILPGEIVKLAKEEPATTLFMAVLIEVFQEALDTEICGPCRTTKEYVTGMQCQSCRKRLCSKPLLVSAEHLK